MEVDEIHVYFNISKYEGLWAVEQREKLVKQEMELLEKLHNHQETQKKSPQPEAVTEKSAEKAKLKQELRDLLQSMQKKVKRMVDNHVESMNALDTIIKIRKFFLKHKPQPKQIEAFVKKLSNGRQQRWEFSTDLAQFLSFEDLKKARQFLKGADKNPKEETASSLLAILVESSFNPPESSPIPIAKIFSDYPLGRMFQDILSQTPKNSPLLAGLPTVENLLAFYNKHTVAPVVKGHLETFEQLAEQLEHGAQLSGSGDAMKGLNELIGKLAADPNTKDIADELKNYLDNAVREMD